MTAVLLLILSASVAAPPAPNAALPPEVDEAAYRQGLRERGLQSWLEAYLAENPPVDAVDKNLREREDLLARAASASDPVQKRGLIEQGTQLLQDLISAAPQDPRAIAWRMELSRDLLERINPDAFDVVLLYELPGRQRDEAARLARRAGEQLDAVRKRIAAAWESLSALDEASMQKIRSSGSVRQLEQFDQQAALLRAWVRLYQLLCVTESPERRASAAQLLDDVAGAGWLELGPGQEGRRCSAMVLAMISARMAGRFDQSEQSAREIIAFLKLSSAAVGAPARQASLLVVIEQVRNLRDGGNLAMALLAARQASDWVFRNRAGEIPPAIAAAFLEASILARQEAAATSPAEAGTMFPPAWFVPFDPLIRKSPEFRDALYHALGGVFGDAPPVGDSFTALQLWAGSHLDEAANDAGRLQQAAKVVDVLQQVLSGGNNAGPQGFSLAELEFLVGRAAYLLKNRSLAISSMGHIAEKWPSYDRASIAARNAWVIAQQWLIAATPAEAQSARRAFIEAARTWRKRSTSASETQGLTLQMAAVLEKEENWSEAATEYAQVDKSHPDHILAMLGRARCLRRLVMTSVPAGSASQPAVASPDFDPAIRAAEEAAASAVSAKVQDCLVAEAVVSYAELLNDVHVRRPAKALQWLDTSFEKWKTCAAWLAPGQRARLEALRQLKQWGETLHTYRIFIEGRPANGVTLGISLLKAMRAAILDSLDRDRADEARSAAPVGAELASVVLNASTSGTAPADDVRQVVSAMRAWFLAEAGRPAEALALFETCDPATDNDSVVFCALGRARCLLALDRAAEAVPIFNNLFQRLPEQSPSWWEAYSGLMGCHLTLHADNAQIVQSIRQRRRLAPDLGGPRWRRTLEQIEKRALTTMPADTSPH